MPSPKYTVGQRVEVLATDFETPSFPEVWMPGTVRVVDPMDSGRWDVEVDRDNGRTGVRQVVGQRGGDNLIRAL